MQYVDTAPGMTAVDVAAAWLTNVNDVMAINNLTAVELPEGTSRVLIPSCKINVAPVSLKPSTTANKTRGGRPEWCRPAALGATALVGPGLASRSQKLAQPRGTQLKHDEQRRAPTHRPGRRVTWLCVVPLPS